LYFVHKPTVTRSCQCLCAFSCAASNIPDSKINELKVLIHLWKKERSSICIYRKTFWRSSFYIRTESMNLVESRMRSFKKRYRSGVQLNEHRVLATWILLRFYFDEPFSINYRTFVLKKGEKPLNGELLAARIYLLWVLRLSQSKKWDIKAFMMQQCN
jgi:hypothetical protein